jgi:ketosteroid isomerase-like protein
MTKRDYEILGDVEIEGEQAEEINKKINEAEQDIAEKQIKSTINKRLEAIRKKDIDGTLAFYSPDVISFDVVNPLRFSGIDSVRKRLEEWFSTFDGTIGFEVSDLKIETSGDIAYCYCLSHVNARTKSGGDLNMWWRETTCYKKIDYKWLITHAHSSVPFDTGTGKASLDLKP